MYVWHRSILDIAILNGATFAGLGLLLNITFIGAYCQVQGEIGAPVCCGTVVQDGHPSPQSNVVVVQVPGQQLYAPQYLPPPQQFVSNYFYGAPQAPAPAQPAVAEPLPMTSNPMKNRDMPAASPPPAARSRPTEVQRVVVRKVVKSFEARAPGLSPLSEDVSAAPVTTDDVATTLELMSSVRNEK